MHTTKSNTVVVRKSASGVVVKAAAGDRTLRFTVTSEAIDRDGDVVIAKGLRWDEYLRNPVVLWSHTFNGFPVGKCVGIGLDADGTSVWADIEFAETTLGNEVFKLVSGGFLNATSIGFRIIRASPPGQQILSRFDPTKKCNRIIEEANLLEISLTPIPSNPEALRKAIADGLVISKSLRETLLAAPRPIGAAIDRIKKTLGWGDETLAKLTLAETKGLANAIKAEPTDTAEGDAVCSECGKSKGQCRCDKPRDRHRKPDRQGGGPADGPRPTDASPGGTPAVEGKRAAAARIPAVMVRSADEVVDDIAKKLSGGIATAAATAVVAGVAAVAVAKGLADEARRRRGH